MGKKRKIFIVIFAAIIVMIHAGGGTIYNAYARSYDGRVNLKIYQVGNLFQNSRSFHTSAMGQFICAFNRWEREPKVLVGVINGNLPILFYNNEKDTYGYVDKTGKVIIKDDLGYASEFYDTGVANVSGGFIDTTGKILNPAPKDTEDKKYKLADDLYDETNEVIFSAYEIKYTDEKYKYIIDDYCYCVTDIHGDKTVELTQEQFDGCFHFDGPFLDFDDQDKVNELLETLGMAKEQQ